MSSGGGGSGASSPEGRSWDGGDGAWRRIYDRVEALLLPRVEELAADRARLEARLLQVNASRERWKTAYIQKPLLVNPKIADLQESDLVDSKAWGAPFDSQLKIQSKEAGNSAETSQENADHGGIAGDFRVELRKLKQAHETLCSSKDKEISAAKVFLWNQLTRMEKEKDVEVEQANQEVQQLQRNVEELQMVFRNRDEEIGLLKGKEVDAAQKLQQNVEVLQMVVRNRDEEIGLLKMKEVEAAQKLQQSVEVLQVALQNKDDENGRLRAEVGLLKMKEVEAAQKLQQSVEVLQVALQNKDDENGRLRAEVGLVKIKEVKAAQKLQQTVEELQMAVRNRDDENGRLRAEVGLLKIKEVETVQKLQQNVEELQMVVRNRDDENGRLRAEVGLLKIKEVEEAQKLQQNVEELQMVVINRDEEIGRLRAEVGILKIKEVEAAQKLQQDIEELQMTVRNRDEEIGRLHAELGLLKIKEVETAQKLQRNVEVDDENGRLRAEADNAEKKVLVLEAKLLEMHSWVKEQNDEIQQLKNGQPQSLKSKCASFISNGTNDDSDKMNLEQCTAEASRDRWKTSPYIELPLLASPKILELEENDLADSRSCEAPFGVGDSEHEIQQKGSRNCLAVSQSNEDHMDITTDLSAEIGKLKQACETLSSSKDKEDSEASQKFQQSVEELQEGKKDDEIARLRAQAVNTENKETSQKRLDQCTHLTLPYQNMERNKGLTYTKRKRGHGVQKETLKAATESRQTPVADNLAKRQKNIKEIVVWKDTSIAAGHVDATRTRNSKRKDKGISTQPEPLQVVMPAEAATSASTCRGDKVKATKRLRIQDQDRTEQREEEVTNDIEDIYIPNSEDNDNEDSEAEDDEEIKTGKRGMKRKTIAKYGGNKKKFENKVRGSFKKVLEAWNVLKPRHKEKVEKAGFGNIQHCKILGVISRPCICFLMNKLDTKDMTIKFGGDKVIKITSKAIHELFGFPNGNRTPPRPSKTAFDEDYRNMKKELGFNNHTTGITIKNLLEKLKEFVQIEDTKSDDKALKVFFLIVFHKLICAPHADRIAREAPMVVNMEYEKMAEMDFCEVIVEEIKRAAEAWQTHKRPIEWQAVEGLTIAPLIMYLDSLVVPKIRTNLDLTTPRANYLDEKTLKKIAKEDMEKDGGKDPDEFEYGKIKSWKGKSDRVFYYDDMDKEWPSSSMTLSQQKRQQVFFAGGAIQEGAMYVLTRVESST